MRCAVFLCRYRVSATVSRGVAGFVWGGYNSYVSYAKRLFSDTMNEYSEWSVRRQPASSNGRRAQSCDADGHPARPELVTFLLPAWSKPKRSCSLLPVEPGP